MNLGWMIDAKYWHRAGAIVIGLPSASKQERNEREEFNRVLNFEEGPCVTLEGSMYNMSECIGDT
jgi:hypothetical protein